MKNTRKILCFILAACLFATNILSYITVSPVYAEEYVSSSDSADYSGEYVSFSDFTEYTEAYVSASDHADYTEVCVSSSDSAGYTEEHGSLLGYTPYSETYRSGDLLFAIIDGSAAVIECDVYAAGTVTVPDTVNGYPVTAIAPRAFSGCAELVSVVLPAVPVSIGDYAFMGCTMLESIEAPGGVEAVGGGAFFGCGDVELLSGGAGNDEKVIFADDEEILGIRAEELNKPLFSSDFPHNNALADNSKSSSSDAMDNIIGQILTFPKSIDVSSLSISKSNVNSYISKLMSRFQTTLPIEYVATSITTFAYTCDQSNTVMTLLPRYKVSSMDKTKYEQRLSTLHNIVDPVIAECEYKDTYQTIKHIHDYLVLNSKYDDSLSKFTAYELLTGKTGVCQAYSEAFDMFMNLKGIKSVTLTTSYHGWNAVYFDNKWYHVDVTWDDPVPDRSGEVSYKHFLLKDSELLAKDEKDQHKKWSPSSVSSTAGTYSKLHRSTSKTQLFVPDYSNPVQNDRWYYYGASAEKITATDRYGNAVTDNNIPDSGKIVCATVHDGVFYYSTGRNIKAFCPKTGVVKTLHTLSSSEGTREASKCPVTSISVNSSGTLTYKYRDWTLSGNTYTSKTVAGKTKINTKSAGNLMGAAFDPQIVSVELGKTRKLASPLKPSNNAAAVNWASSDTSKVTVSNTGVVTGKAKTDSSPVTVTATAGGYTSSCSVYVKAAEVRATGITLDSKLSLVKGKTSKLNAVLTPSNSTDKIVWTSSDPSVATVDSNGNVRAVEKGTAVINARARGESASCTVTVKIPATGIALDKTSATIAKGSTFSLTATVEPYNTTDKITWSSTDTGIATVTNGTVKGIAQGQTVIKAKAGNYTAECTVNVTNSSYVVSVDGKNYTSFSSAMASNTANKVYKLLSDADCSLPTGKQITVDLNGYAIKATNPNGYTVTINANSDGTVTYTALDVKLPKARQASLSLEGELAINFSVQLSDEIIADPGNYALRCVRSGNTTLIPVSKSRKLNNSTYPNMYSFYYSGIYATQMGDDVSIDVVDVRDNKELCSPITYSVKKYAENKLSKSTTSASLKALLKAMLNYGAASQEYFGVNTRNLVNNISQMSASDRNAVNSVEIPSSFNKLKTGGKVNGIEPQSVSLSLGSQTYINILFKVAQGTNINDYTFSCEGETLTKPRLEQTADGYDYYRITLEDIASYELDTVFRVIAKKNGSEDYTYVDYSGLTYAYRKQYMREESLAKLCKSLYLYNKAANKYFNR